MPPTIARCREGWTSRARAARRGPGRAAGVTRCSRSARCSLAADAGANGSPPRSSTNYAARRRGFQKDGEMETLTQMRCVACRKDAPTLTDAEITGLRAQVSDWDIVE